MFLKEKEAIYKTASSNTFTYFDGDVHIENCQ